MLRENIKSLDAILITHEHNDHIIGMDDVRPFNFMQRKDMPVFATEKVQEQLKKRFSYVFATENKYPGAPMVKLITINKDTVFNCVGHEIMPFEVIHGKLPVLGFRIGSFAYITDMKTISQQELEKIKGVNHLVINALHHNEHSAHLNLKEALEFINLLNPEKAYLIHISHRMGTYAELNPQLPPNVQLGYDGMQLKIRDLGLGIKN